MNSNVLQVIAEYEMSKKEAEAYKVGCMYEYLVQNLFPGIIKPRFGNGDPRKKELFKYAWKMINDIDIKSKIDIRDYISPADYKLYIYAQLKVLKAYFDKGKEIFVRPSCLVGPKAWKRWHLFKIIYEQRQKFRTIEQAGLDVNPFDKVKSELVNTKEYFKKRFNRLDKTDIISSLNNDTIQRWIIMKQVSGYYPYHSPVVDIFLKEKGLSIQEYFGYALSVYKGGTTQESINFFRKEFNYEF